MSLSVKTYRTSGQMSNEEIAKRLGVSLQNPHGSLHVFSGFWRGNEWIGGKADSCQFTITLRKGAEELHKKAEVFATFVGES
jgi:hypothetical protein